jgi:4-hydroxy-4-methyl-2-oxoglutarate aldolase
MTKLSSATTFEAYGQRGALPSEIKPVGRGVHVAGPAYPVQCAPADNLSIHLALAEAPAGSVLVCHTGGWHDAGYVGDVILQAAVARGVAGIVIDGCVRDSATLSGSGCAVFSRGLSIRGTTKDPKLPGTVNTRIRVGLVDIDPGDLVIGDDDGVVVVRASDVDDALRRGAERDAKEEDLRARLAAGETTMALYGFPTREQP